MQLPSIQGLPSANAVSRTQPKLWPEISAHVNGPISSLSSDQPEPPVRESTFWPNYYHMKRLTLTRRQTLNWLKLKDVEKNEG